MKEVKNELAHALIRGEGGVAVIDSRVIAREFDKEHKHVLRDIRVAINKLVYDQRVSPRKDGVLIDDGTLFAMNSTYLDVRGRSRNHIVMNDMFAKNVFAGYTGSKARRISAATTATLSDMRKELGVNMNELVRNKLLEATAKENEPNNQRLS